MENDIKAYRAELEDERDVNRASMINNFVNDFKEVVRDIKEREFNNIGHTKDFVIAYVDYYDSTRSMGGAYKTHLNKLKENIRTHKAKKH